MKAITFFILKFQAAFKGQNLDMDINEVFGTETLIPLQIYFKFMLN